MAFTRFDTANGTAYLITERRSSIVLLAFTEIPLWEEMDVELPGLDGHVEAMAKRARAIAARRGVGVHVIGPRTRQPADLILREAQRRKAQLIVLGATGRSRTSHRALAHDVVTRRISDQARVPTMFIQAPVAA